MSDIVERLRVLGADSSYAPPATFANACAEAAAKITRLRAALDAERERCAQVADTHGVHALLHNTPSMSSQA